MKLKDIGNSFPKLILKSPLHALMSGRYMLLTFKGRRSGRSYTTPVAYLRRQDTVILTTDSPWWSNLMGGAPVTVQLRGATRTGMADVIQGTEAAAEGLAALVEAIPSYGKFAGVRRDEQGHANEDDTKSAIEGGRVLIRIELETEVRGSYGTLPGGTAR